MYVNRTLQGGTRHGLPDLDGVLYTSTVPVSAVAEVIRDFRGRTLENEDLKLYGNRLSLVTFELDAQVTLIDLCDQNLLSQIAIDPMQIATKDRTLSQRVARQLYAQGAPGFLWWSSLEAKWTNASLFESRILTFLSVLDPIIPLAVDQPVLIEAARALGVLLKKRKSE
jgi:hypothetical protein